MPPAPHLLPQLLGLFLAVAPMHLAAQEPDSAAPPAPAQPPQPAVTLDDSTLTRYAAAYTDIAVARDTFQARLAEAGNKTDDAQAELRHALRDRVAEILAAHELTPARYEAITFRISTESDARERFRSAMERLAEPGAGEAEAEAEPPGRNGSPPDGADA